MQMDLHNLYIGSKADLHNPKQSGDLGHMTSHSE